MCGIVGIAIASNNGFFSAERDSLEAALVVNNLRGADSTGIVAVDNKLMATTMKSVGTAWDLFRMPDYAQLRNELIQRGKLVIGHGRAATRGDVSAANAHPFTIEKDGRLLSMVHNGTLREFGQPWPDFKDFAVDSEWLADKLFKYGPQETFGKVDGAMAVLWWDSAEKALFAYRNDERPLSIAVTPRGDVLFNSELGALKMLNNKFNLHIDEKKFFNVGPGKLHKFPVNDPAKLEITEIKRIIVPWHDRYNAAGEKNNTHHHTSHHRGSTEYDVWRGRAAERAGRVDDDSDTFPHTAAANDGLGNLTAARRRSSLRGPLTKTPAQVEVIHPDFQWMAKDNIAMFEYLRVFSGLIERVSYSPEGNKMQQHRNATLSFLGKVPAPKENLVEVMHVRPGEIKETYQYVKDGVKTTERRFYEFKNVFKEKAIALPQIPAPVVHLPNSPSRHEVKKKVYAVGIALSNKRGKRVHFHTKKTLGTEKRTIRHDAVVTSWNEDHFDVYANDRDGVFAVGAPVVFEAFQLEQSGVGVSGKPIFSVYGCLVSEEASWSCIDIVCRLHDFDTKEEIYNAAIFTGVVSFIRLMTAEQHKGTGGYVEIELTRCKPASTADENDIRLLEEFKKLDFNGAVAKFKKEATGPSTDVDDSE